jgi:hypothetical protein
MKAGDVMVRNVITVGPDACVAAIPSAPEETLGVGQPARVPLSLHSAARGHHHR